MRQTKTDRRSLRTRQLLSHALIDLIRVKRYDTITVQEVTDRANVGRSTFYAHFTDKDDLLADGVHQLIAGLDATARAVPAGRQPWLYPTLALFDHVGTQPDMYQILARGRGLTLFVNALHGELTAVFAERLAARVPPGAAPAVTPTLLAAMVASMLVTAIRTWIEDGLAEPAETINRAFRIAADAAIRAGLGPVLGYVTPATK